MYYRSGTGGSCCNYTLPADFM